MLKLHKNHASLPEMQRVQLRMRPKRHHNTRIPSNATTQPQTHHPTAAQQQHATTQSTSSSMYAPAAALAAVMHHNMQVLALARLLLPQHSHSALSLASTERAQYS